MPSRYRPPPPACQESATAGSPVTAGAAAPARPMSATGAEPPPLPPAQAELVAQDADPESNPARTREDRELKEAMMRSLEEGAPADASEQVHFPKSCVEDDQSLCSTDLAGDFTYRLVSVVSHHGGATHSGHYVSDVYSVDRDRSGWPMQPDQAPPGVVLDSVPALVQHLVEDFAGTGRNVTMDRSLMSKGPYRRVHRVLDTSGWYYLAGEYHGEYHSCGQCAGTSVSYDHRLLRQLPNGRRGLFPAVLTHMLACDRAATVRLQGRTLGNSPTACRNSTAELHDEA
ncbi:hypothetical protein FJT64_027563 [Amphibalanus amphitrite]|uniref:Uncharacterized protein n=1 Tax=Amphibalanus amphitrite TaxID=1232801 RepID=A0A6A4WCL3_AMPAM|nr:hypothetical protein FJT64_027563 [Amphibalanus amphitrite]